MTRATLYVATALALAALGWVVGGLVMMVAGLDELDLPARAAGVFLALSLGEAGFAKIMSGHR